MPMGRTLSVLRRGTVKSLKLRSVFIKARYSAPCSSPLCLKPCHVSSTLGSPGRISTPKILLSSLNRSRNVSGGSWLRKEAMEEKGLSKCRKDKDHDLWYGTGPLAEFRRVSMCHLSSAMAASTWCTRNAVGSSAWQRTLITDVHGARELHPPWMADHRGKSIGPDKLEVVASFCSLGDMLSAAGGCELSTTTRVITAWKKFMELLPVLSSRHLFFKTCGRVDSSCAECNVPSSETCPMTKPNLQRLQWQGNDQTDLQCQAARHCRHQIQWATCMAWHWGSGPHSEGQKAPLVRTCGMLQWCSCPRQLLTYRLMESVGLGSQTLMTWKELTERDGRERKFSAIKPYDRHNWRSGVRSAIRAASQLPGRGPTDVDVAPVPAR